MINNAGRYTYVPTALGSSVSQYIVITYPHATTGCPLIQGAMGITQFDYDLSQSYLNFTAFISSLSIPNFTIKITTFKDTNLLGSVKLSYFIVDPSFSIKQRIHLISIGIVYLYLIYSHQHTELRCKDHLFII